MEVLKDWIGPRVHQALTEALDWKTQGSPVTKDGQVDFEDDGTSLRVRSSKKELVQICKIEEASRPVQLWLSDSKTLLKVIVAAAAAERFEREHKRRVTEGTLGALIQILDYEIVAQHHGPKRTKITMLINNFQHIGSDGSPAFGNPCSIECQPPIIELLDKLQTLRAQEQPSSQSLASFKAARDHIDSPSQANSTSSADDGRDRSQGFATQIPRLQSKKRLREGSLKPNALDESDRARSLDFVKGGDGSDRAIGAESPSRHGAQELPLSQVGQASSNPMDIQEKLNGESDSENRVPEQEEPEKQSRNKFEDIIIKRGIQLLDLLERNKAKPEHLNRVPKPHKQEKQDPRDLRDPQNPRDPQDPQDARDPQDPQDPVTSASKNPSPDRQTSPSIAPSQQSRVTKPAQRLSSKPARKLPKTLTRISSRDIRIPRDQRDLLDRPDSWYPPEPGHRTPSANIPICVLQELNSQAERQASPIRESSQVSSQAESSEVEENDNQSFESEEPFSSGEWPASPPRQVVLPPDSSLDSARSSIRNLKEQSPEPEHDHDLNITKSIEEDCSSLKPRPSIDSLSSQSDMGSRSYLPHTTKTNSSRASHHSSKVSTPLQSRSPAPLRNATEINLSPAKHPSGLARQKAGHAHSHDNYTIDAPDVSHTSDTGHVSEENDSKCFRAGILDTANPLSLTSRYRETRSKVGTIASSVNSRRNSSSLNLALEPSNSPSKQNGKLQSEMTDIGLSESESDLETSMPHGLDEANDISSTIIPFTQVNRTTYLSNDSLRSPLSPSSPTGANKEFSRRATGRMIEVRKSHLPQDTDGHAGYSRPRSDGGSFVRQTNSSATDQHISMIEETVLPPGTLPDPSNTSIMPPNLGINSNLDLKRKASEPILSPNVTKRKKAPKLDRVMSDLGTTGRKVDPEDIGRQLRQEFFAHRKNLTAQSNDDDKDATGILDGFKSASTDFPQVINDDHPEKPTSSIIRENPSPPDETVGNSSTEGTLTALKTEAVVLTPRPDAQAQDVPYETRTENLVHNDPKESDVGSVHQAEVAPNVIQPAEVNATACPPKTLNSVFDRFIMTYPDYPGNSVQFAAICTRICTLFQEDRMEHPSLWDDFIVRHRTEYPQYMSQCADEAVDPMPFERYYRSKVLQAKYVSPKGPVVTPVNIREFQRHEVKPKTSRTSESSFGKDPPIATSNREEPKSDSIEVIELSDQEDLFKPAEKAQPMGSSKSKQVRRSLPWKNSGQVPTEESPYIKQTVSTPVASVAQERSSAKASVFKSARQKATPISPPAGKPSARGEKASNPLSQSRLRQRDTANTSLHNHHPPPKNSNSNAKPVKRSNEIIDLSNDPHSPYNTFARNYQAITPGKGNSYAQENGSMPKTKEKLKWKPFDPSMLEL